MISLAYVGPRIRYIIFEAIEHVNLQGNLRIFVKGMRKKCIMRYIITACGIQTSQPLDHSVLKVMTICAR